MKNALYITLMCIMAAGGWFVAQRWTGEENRSIVGMFVAEKINIDLMISIVGGMTGFVIGAILVGMYELGSRAMAINQRLKAKKQF